jgi:hypothetical protein
MAALYWISTGQALVWAGSPEELVKACARSGLLARYKFLLLDGRGHDRPDSYIPVSWWLKALSVHIEADRITFTLPGPTGTRRVLTAFGVEFLGGAAEKLFPPSERLKRIKAVPATITAAVELLTAKPPPPPKHAGDVKPVHAWEGAARHVSAVVKRDGLLPRNKNGQPNLASAVRLLREWLMANDTPPFPTRQTYYRWLGDNPHPEWWAVSPN